MAQPEQITRWETAQDGLDKLIKSSHPMPTPGKDEILVEIRTVSLNYRDTEVAMGLYTHHKAIENANVVPCSDMCGTIISIGDNKSDSWNIGDRVLSIFNQSHLAGQIRERDMAFGLGLPLDGVLQTHRIFPVAGLVKTPDYLTDEEACTLPIAAVTAWMSINGMRPIDSAVEPEQTILLQGTGGVSVAGLQIGHAAGAETIITSSSDEKLARAKSLGATHTINYHKVDDWQDAVMGITHNEGAGIILETGGAHTLRKSFDCISFGGIIACIGYLSGKQDDPADHTNLNVLALRRTVTLRGILNGPRDRFEEMLRYYEAKKIRPAVDKVFAFDDAKEALQYLYGGRHFGKVVIRVKA